MRRGACTTYLSLGCLAGGLVLGCSTDPVGPPISVTVTPESILVLAGSSQGVSATVVNDPASKGVTWSITGCVGDASVCGSLTSVTTTSATYDAPIAVPPASVGVTATSVADPAKSAAARVTVSDVLSIEQTQTNSGDQQTGTVGAALPNPLRVLVRRGAVAAPGVAVFWVAKQGTLSARTTITDASGIAMVRWTLDTVSGQESAGAGVGPDTLPSIAFSAMGNPGPPIQMGFSVQPVNVFAGRPFLRSVRIAAFDRYGNVATDFRGSVTVALGPSGALAGATTVAAVLGVATFADLSIAQAGIGYTLTASATGLTDITSTRFDVVAPGARRIAFSSDRDGNDEIYSMNADGSGVIRLTSDPATDLEPNWSRDGLKVAFVRGTSVYAMSFDGSGLARLTDSSFYPAWSHDGTRIAASRGSRVCGRGCRIGNLRIVVMNADGSGRVILSSGTVPTWSPDGRIAFANAGEIYVMNADGSALTNLTNDPASDGFPAWSPDGTKIAFVSNRAAASDLYVMNADGTGVTQLTHHPTTAAVGRPAWSADGTRIVFANTTDGDFELYVVNADGSGVVALTDNTAFDGWPAWSP